MGNVRMRSGHAQQFQNLRFSKLKGYLSKSMLSSQTLKKITHTLVNDDTDRMSFLKALERTRARRRAFILKKITVMSSE